jgi:hypothetical protein
MFSYQEYNESYTQRECYVCEEKEKDLNSVKEWMTSLIQQLYGREPFDLMMVENCLDEIAHYMGLKLPEEDLQIISKKRRPTPLTDQILDKWKALNNKYLKSLEK